MLKSKRDNFIALGICAIACCAWSYILDCQYYHLAYYSWDLGLYANLMWNLCHGSMQTTLFDGNFLIDHFNLIAFAFIPFYFFFQSALTILYFKLFAFFAAAYIFYLLASKRVGGLWAIAFMLAYILYPANVAMLFFEFNFENLALPLIFLAFYFFEENKFTQFLVTCVALTLVKENMPMAVFMFGVYGLMKRREDWLRWGLSPLVLGAGMFLGEVFVFIPCFRHGLSTPNAHWGLYASLGHSPTEVLRTIIFKEPYVFKILFNPHNLFFLAKLFGPLVIVAFLAPRILFLATPFFLQDLLSKSHGQQSIDTFYSSTLTVFIFMAAIDLLGRIKAKWRIYLFALMIALLMVFDLFFLYQGRDRVISFKEEQAVGQYILSKIPQDAKVITSYKFLYLLSQRKDLYVLLSKHTAFTHLEQKIPDDVDYMMVDFSSRVDHKDDVEKLLAGGLWKVEAAAEEIVLLRKNTTHGDLLIQEGKHPFKADHSFKPVMLGDALRLDGLSIPTALRYGQRVLRVVLYWKAINNDKNTHLPEVYINISQGSRLLYFKSNPPFYGFPIEKGKYYAQAYYYLIPLLSSGNYSVIISPLLPWTEDSRQASPNEHLLKVNR